jgi:uncharacterized protein YhbP (UPF0306 family)
MNVVFVPMQKALAFIKNQQLLSLATCEGKDVWIATGYYAVDDNGTIYFISAMDAKHSQMIAENQKVAFSVTWFDPSNHKNRKGIQGQGVCRLAENPTEIATGISLLYKKFPDLRDILTVKWILENAWGSRVWVIKPKYLKHWDDELYGEDECKEFTIE